MPTAVLLIPGFFGFGQFGDAPGPTLEYFADVKRVFARRRPDLRVYAHEPPPTGPLDARVASLHDAVSRIHAGQPLPHEPDVVTADRIHLIGHSAGGVDAWLYTRPRFSWTGGPSPQQRAALLATIGDVVTLSAPFRGTPIATHARLERDVALFLSYLLVSMPLRALSGAVIAQLAALVLGDRRRGEPLSALAGYAARLRPAMGSTFASNVHSFLMRIVEDRRLLADLTVESMAGRNNPAFGPSHSRLRSYVSVSPVPGSVADGRIDPLGRYLYQHLYDDTARGDTPGPIPYTQAGGIELGAGVRQLLRMARANDGVVPVTSQTLNGVAAGLVLGDHLDVTGHYEGARQRNLFTSGAQFDHAEFGALWTHIAQNLA